MAQKQAGGLEMKVLDVLNHPHGGRILRVRLKGNDLPVPKELRGLTLNATGPRGQERRVSVRGFSLTGGRVSRERLEETRRLDLHVEEEGDGPPVDLRWKLTPI